jgi:hypothetical protein
MPQAGITTVVKSSTNGAGNVVATGFGKQRTVRYDHAVSVDRNHGLAAGTLALALGIGWDDSIRHEVTGNGFSARHRFYFPG